MTENTLTRTPSRLILPNDIPAGIEKLYNGLQLIELYRKGDFLSTFGRLGVRRFGKFKDYSDFFVYFHARLWEWVLRQVIDNHSVVILGKNKIMLQSYQMKPHLNPDLFANQFRLTVPVFKQRSRTSLIWVTRRIIEEINTPGRYSNVDSRILRQSDVKEHMMTLFPQLTKRQLNSLVSFSISAMHRFVKASMNPTIKYDNTSCVVGDFYLGFKQMEGVGFKNFKREAHRDKQLKQFVQHVKRNYN